MKEYHYFECDFCGIKSTDRDDIALCESRGRAEKYPIGLIYCNIAYDNVVFAVARNNIEGHENHFWNWSCSDNGSGDHLDEDLVKSALLKISETSCYIDRSLPAFKRMVNFLLSNDIVPCVYENGEIKNI